MLKEVQDVIKRIEAFLADKDNFETVVEDNYLTIRVFPRNGEPSAYHGYELYLMEKVVATLGHTLDFKLSKDEEGVERFLVTTEANFNLMSYIRKMNDELAEVCRNSDELCTVFVCEKLTEESRGEFTILTGYSNGTWTRCDITKAELLFAATHNIQISPNENGVFWYEDLIQMSNTLFDELENLSE